MTGPDVVRPMAPADVEAAGAVWNEAFAEMRVRRGFPSHPVDGQRAAGTEKRLRYFLASDPEGSWVAVDGDGTVVGVAQALRRGRLWVLSMLAVAVACQGRGIGRLLLDAGLGYAEPDDTGLILSSADPRAMRRYVAAGFALHPVVAAAGTVRRERIAVAQGVREGSAADLDLTAEVDGHVRGAARVADITHLLDDGAGMLVVEGRGYAVARGSQPVMVAALDVPAARDLLAATLTSGPPDQEVEVGWLSGDQQWAVEVVVGAGLELRLSGAIMVRGKDRPFSPYIANGAFG